MFRACWILSKPSFIDKVKKLNKEFFCSPKIKKCPKPESVFFFNHFSLESDIGACGRIGVEVGWRLLLLITGTHICGPGASVPQGL